MRERKTRRLWLEAMVIVISFAALLLLLYFVFIVSFQEGSRSSGVTMNIAARIAQRICENPTEAEVEIISRILRYFAHLGLFFVVGVVMTFVSMVLFRGYYRILGAFLSGGVCYFLAFYTEYYKQFIEGRHFQMTDVVLNWYGSVAGIAGMVLSYFMNRLLVKLSSRLM